MPPRTPPSRAVHKAVVVAICVGVATLHLVTGPGYRGPFRGFVTGYLMDLLLPFAMVLLLGVATEDPPVRVPALARAGAVALVGLVVEWMQFRGVPLFGRTADLLDIAAYAGGALLALGCEQTLLARHRSSSS